ncbi:phosphate-starvation-inducible PsiE family protein [Thermithiobacillus plumbiphilus]|uniref:Phosphate-starvation-inducible PsiE family protein n=1 Tax=Thermithiobacillus plumbiphilus TaxID=1729899 RepID=A0ABU9D5J7_9PROT
MDLKRSTLSAYGWLLDLLVIGLILVMLVTLALSFIRLVQDLWLIVPGALGGEGSNEKGLHQLVINVLGVFVLIELFRTFTDYIEFHRIRLHVLADVSIVFILRELLIGLYGHTLQWMDILSLAALLLVLVGMRTLAIRVSPPKERVKGPGTD